MRSGRPLVLSIVLLAVGQVGCAARAPGNFSIPPMPQLTTAQAWQLKGDSLVSTVYRSTRLIRMHAEERPGVRAAVTNMALGSAGALASAFVSNKTAKTVGEISGGLVTIASTVQLVRALRGTDNACLVDIDKATLAWDGAGKADENMARDAYVHLRHEIANTARKCPHIGSALTVTGVGLAGF
jgi:hypothetical protein